MKKLILTSACAFIMLACGNNKKNNDKDADASATITIDGSSTVYPITEAIAEEFRGEFPDVNITIGVSGTGGGFKKFGRGEIDIANASRPIKDSEGQDAAKNNISYVKLDIAYDGLAVVVNPANDWVKCLTVEQLKKIWEPAAQGKITKWNQIDPSWPNEDIRLFGPGVASGTFDYFTEVIVGESGKSRGDYTASEDDNILVQGVSGDKFGLGFFGLAYFEENSDKLRMVPVDGGKGCITASTETVSNGTYAPLSRPLSIYVSSSAIKNPQVINFINFYLKNAPLLLKDVGYVPMTTAEYAAEVKKFEEFVAKNK